jgi:hypothetical protein
VGVVIRVERRDGKLTRVDPAENTWRPILAVTNDPDTFTIKPGVRESGEQSVFRRRPDGRVASLFLACRTFRRVDPVE